LNMLWSYPAGKIAASHHFACRVVPVGMARERLDGVRLRRVGGGTPVSHLEVRFALREGRGNKAIKERLGYVLRCRGGLEVAKSIQEYHVNSRKVKERLDSLEVERF